ncbi:hypothetical protein J6590_069225 [Homalodisca vitripennis]|nr:hypothetical protein J6590_069225 [Homalodisca vitripennis]
MADDSFCGRNCFPLSVVITMMPAQEWLRHLITRLNKSLKPLLETNSLQARYIGILFPIPYATCLHQAWKLLVSNRGTIESFALVLECLNHPRTAIRVITTVISLLL